jgi:hypothetical protein
MLAINEQYDAVATSHVPGNPAPANLTPAGPPQTSPLTTARLPSGAQLDLTLAADPSDVTATQLAPMADAGTGTGTDQSWLLDWTRLWAGAAASIFDASASLAGSAQGAAVVPTTPVASSELALWSQSSWSSSSRAQRPAPRPKSWYRKPQPNLFDPAAWGFPAPFAVSGSVFGIPVTPQIPLGYNPMQAWSPVMNNPITTMMLAMQPTPAIGSFVGWPSLGAAPFGGSNYGSGFGMPFSPANPFARLPENPVTAWFSTFSQPQTPWDKMANAVTTALTPNPYASYRSDSGYAVAQIATPAKTATTTASDATAAFWNMFAWPTTATQ